MQKKAITLVIFATITAFVVWSPWLTKRYAETRASDSFNQSWIGVIDGCGTNCTGCGAVSSRRIPFGVEVTLEYGCGLMPADTSEYHERATGLVSALGTVHGFPRP